MDRSTVASPRLLVKGAMGAALLAILAAAVLPESHAVEGAGRFPFTGLARPFRAAAIGVEVTGVVDILEVQPGETVAAGDPLFRLDTSVEKLAVDRAAARAQSEHGIAMANATLDKALQDEAMVRDLMKQGIGTEITEAEVRLAARLAGLAVDEARYEQGDAQLAWQEAKARLARRVAVAPFPGVVDRVHKQAGEAVDQLDPVIDLVQLDPLLVEVHCPIEWAEELAPGTLVPVAPSNNPQAPRSAKVVFRSRRADAASQTCRVHLELANPADDPQRPQWPAGIKVLVGSPASPSSVSPMPPKGR